MTPHRRAATLPVAFFDRPADAVARDLLGALVVSRAGGGITSARIVETEAYLGYRDPASHGYLHRRNERNAALFGPPGSWYVYLSYGIHWCANVVCGPVGSPAAVLVRGGIPERGIEEMVRRRGRIDHLTDGPGKLCAALGITGEHDGSDAFTGEVRIEGRPKPGEITATPRIGISQAIDRLWRLVWTPTLAGS